MFCNRCGAVLTPEQAACPACGQPVTGAGSASGYTPAPARSAQERLAGHVHLLAIFWFVVAFLWLIPAGVMFAVGTVAGAVMPADEPGAAMARALGPLVLYIIAGFILLVAALCFAAGWGLLKLRPWARGLAIVLGIISLLHPPFGTALGVYTLWVLLGNNAGPEYERLATSAG